MEKFFNIANNKLNYEIEDKEIEDIHNIIDEVVKTLKDKINIDTKKSTED